MMNLKRVIWKLNYLPWRRLQAPIKLNLKKRFLKSQSFRQSQNDEQRNEQTFIHNSWFKYYLALGVACCSFKFGNAIQMSNEGQDAINIQVLEINKSQLISLLAGENPQPSLLVTYNKYQRNKEKEFFKELSDLCDCLKKTSVKCIYLCDKNDIKHLQTFEKWLRQEASSETSNRQQNSQTATDPYENTKHNYEYFYLSPNFSGNSFRISEKKHIKKDIREIESFSVQTNPSNETVLQSFDSFNVTSVIKHCPKSSPSDSQDCLFSYTKQISSLIEQGLLKDKTDEFKFYAFCQGSKKDSDKFAELMGALDSSNRQMLTNQQKQNLSPKKQELLILRNDMLGKQIFFDQSPNPELKHPKRGLSLMELIRPRIFIISKSSYETDLFWYISTLQQNKKPTISINNTDQFNLGRKYTVNAENSQQPFNQDLKVIRLLYEKHPDLNFLVVSTSIVSELIRHIMIRNKYVVFNLSSEIPYEKMFLPNPSPNESAQKTYQDKFRNKIQTFLQKPAIYDYVVMNKEQQVNRKRLTELITLQNHEGCILRVCHKKCQQDISNQNLAAAYTKIFKKEPEIGKMTGNGRDWRNEVYERTFWIDTHFNSVGLYQGDYFLKDGMFQFL